MASFINPYRRNSMERPPKIESAFNHLEKELIQLFESDNVQLQRCIENLCRIIGTLHDNKNKAAKVSRDGAIAKAVGGTAMAVGLVLFPFTLGISFLIGGAGAAVATGGVIGIGVWKKKKTKQEEQLMKDFEVELRAIKSKIIPITEKIKDISRRIREIQGDLDNPGHNISYLSKYFTSACELVHFLKIYDIGGLAKLISESVDLTGDITDSFARLSTDNFTEVLQKIIQLWHTMGKIKKTTDKITYVIACGKNQ